MLLAYQIAEFCTLKYLKNYMRYQADFLHAVWYSLKLQISCYFAYPKCPEVINPQNRWTCLSYCIDFVHVARHWWELQIDGSILGRCGQVCLGVPKLFPNNKLSVTLGRFGLLCLVLAYSYSSMKSCKFIILH